MSDVDGDLSLLEQLGARARERRAEDALASIPAQEPAMAERIAARLLARASAAPPEPLRVSMPDLVPTRVRPPGRGLRIGLLVAALALIAAVVGVVLVMGVGSGARGVSTGLPPPYVLTVVSVNDVREPGAAKRGGAAEGAASELRVDPAGELELEARPESPVSGVRARAFLIHGGEVKPWLVPLQISDDGVVRIRGMTRVMFPSTTDDTYDVMMVFALSDALPGAEVVEGIARSGGGGAGGAGGAKDEYRVVRAHVRFVSVPAVVPAAAAAGSGP